MEERKEKFTTGPWEVVFEERAIHLPLGSSNEFRQRRMRVTGDDHLVASCSSANEDRFSELDANAYLIAAAPEMYDLLCELIDAEARNYCDGICLYEFAERAKKILKKARGEE